MNEWTAGAAVVGLIVGFLVGRMRRHSRRSFTFLISHETTEDTAAGSDPPTSDRIQRNQEVDDDR